MNLKESPARRTLPVYAVLFALVSVLPALLVDPQPGHALIANDFGVECEAPGDTIGSHVVSDGDFNGDGINDFAYAAPCAQVRGNLLAGRVFIRSGADGSVLRRLLGRNAEDFMGAVLAFVGDLDGDGNDDLAVTTPGHDLSEPLDPVGDPLLKLPENVGKVEVFSLTKRRPILTVEGEAAEGRLGSAVAGVNDIDGDGVRDLIISDIRAQTSVGRKKKRTGEVRSVSGKDGTTIRTLFGNKNAQKLGLTLENLGSLDADGLDHILVASAKSPLQGVLEAGFVEVLPATDTSADAVIAMSGARQDRFGEVAASDGLGGPFIVGAPGRRLDGVRNVGLVVGMSPTGTRIFEVADLIPQKLAKFGSAVAALGDINGDGVGDFSASAPLADIFIDQETGFLTDAGRISALSGVDGSSLWSVDGQRIGDRIGQSLAGGLDYNGDGVPDIVAGSTGEAPTGRRGAGSVNILSGVDGSVLDSFVGRRGLETRIFVFGKPGLSRVRSFGPDSEAKEVGAAVLSRRAGSMLSVAVMDATRTPVKAGAMRLAVGTGKGGRGPHVVILSAASRKKVLDKFTVSTELGGYNKGVNVAAGDLERNGDMKLLVGMADSRNRDANVAVLRQFKVGEFDEGAWLLDNFFPAFKQDAGVDTGTDDNPTLLPIMADGVNMAVGNLTSHDGLEIVVSPIKGVPVVKLLNKNGDMIRQWLAYNPDTHSGLNVAIGDLVGGGSNKIVTAPTVGRPLIRAFNASGAPFTALDQEEPVAFFATDDGFAGGARVAMSDIDFDGVDEILVVLGAPRSNEILAFEADGTPVEGFTSFAPFASGAQGGETAIAATDLFVRR